MPAKPSFGSGNSHNRNKVFGEKPGKSSSMVAHRPRLIERARRDLVQAMEFDGTATAREDQPSRMVAAEELVDDGLAVVKYDGPLPAGGVGRPNSGCRMLTILPAPGVKGTAPWLVAAGRLKPGQRAPEVPGDGMARMLGVQTSGPEFEALVDALLSRLLPRVIDALRPPAAADLTADEEILRAIDGRTGFTMDQVLAWLGWPLDRPALRTHLGHVLTRLGYGRSRTKGPLGDLRRTYNAPNEAMRSEVADEFADRLAATLADFSCVTQAEVAKLLGIDLDHSTSVKIGRAMPRIGWKKKVRFANSPDKIVEYVRMRR